MSTETEHNRSKRVTIRDVAEHAGLSVSTVSATLNGSGVLKESTREKVRKAAKELGYRPNRVALAFRLGRTGTIGYSLPVVDEGAVSILGLEAYMTGASAAASAAFEAGYGLTLTPPQLRDKLSWNSLAVDGVVVCDPEQNDVRIRILENLNIPFVTLEKDLGRPDWKYSVSGDFKNNTLKMTEHMYEMGARRIALITPEGTWSSTQDSRLAYESWAKEKGLPVLVSMIPTDQGNNDAYQATQQLLLGKKPPDAIICNVEQYQARVLAACQDAGLDVPTDILVAVGEDTRAAQQAIPPLTAIDQHTEKATKKAVQMLLKLIETNEAEGPITIQGTLRKRESTNAKPKHNRTG